MFKMQHMGSFVYRILSLPLSTLVLYTYILSYSPFILLAIITVALAFASQNQTSLEAMLMYAYVAIYKNQTKLKNTHKPPKCVFKIYFSSEAEI